MYVKLHSPTIKIKPRKELKSRDVFFKILFVGWGEHKKCNPLITQKTNLRLVNVKLRILTSKRQTSDLARERDHRAQSVLLGAMMVGIINEL